MQYVACQGRFLILEKASMQPATRVPALYSSNLQAVKTIRFALSGLEHLEIRAIQGLIKDENHSTI